MGQTPVKLKKGMELVKQRGKTGPVREVVSVRRIFPRIGPPMMVATLRWTQHTKRKGAETLEERKVIEADGLPAGYVLAKDRKAVRK